MNEPHESRASWREPHAWAAACVVAALACVVQPVGEFPIFDDFDYSATVYDLVTYREMRLSDWPSMTLVAQAAWGALWCLPAGFSHFALRLSTLALLGIGGAAAYDFARRQGAGRWPAAWIAILIVTSPQTLLLGCTFMTDVPGLAWTLILLACIDRALDRPTTLGLAVTGTLGAAAYLFRQTAIIPLLAGVAIALARRQWIVAVWLAVPTLTAHAGFRWWLVNVNGVPFHATLPMVDPATLTSVAEMGRRGLRTLATCGLYFSPVAVWLLAGKARPWRKSAPMWLFGAGVVLAGFACVASRMGGMLESAGNFAAHFAPYDNWLVFDCGLGADFSLNRADVFSGLGVMVGATPIGAFRVATTLLACIGLAGIACLRLSRRGSAAVWALTLAGTVGFAAISGSFYERYLMPAWSLLTLGAAFVAPPVRSLALTAGASFAVAGVVGTQDYFERTRAVWQAVSELEHRGVSMASVDAGMEVAGEFRFRPLARGATRVRPFVGRLSEGERIALIAPLDFNPFAPYRLRLPLAVGYSDDGDEVLMRFPFRSWVRSGAVYVVKRRLAGGENPR